MTQKNQLETVLSVVAYCSVSIGMIILNKLVMYTYGMNYPNGLLLMQNTGALLLVCGAKKIGLIHFPDFSMQVVRAWMPLTLLFVAMLFTSMKSLNSMSVSAQTIIKSCAIIFTAAGDDYLYGKRVTRGMYLAFVLMISGSYLGAKGDPWVTSWGIFWTFANIVATVGYTLYMKQLLGDVKKQIGRYGPVFYNNLLSIPFFIIGALLEPGDMVEAVLTTTPYGKFFLLLVTVLSSGMTFTVFWCMEMTSPTTFSVFGALNKVPLSLLGIVIFKQYPEPMGYVGISLALSAGFLYTYLNIQEEKRNKEKEAQARAAEHQDALNPMPNSDAKLL